MLRIRKNIFFLNRTSISNIAKRLYSNENINKFESLKLSFSLPHKTIYSNTEIQQINLSSVVGDLGIVSNHISIVEELKAGLVEIIHKNGESKKLFITGGMAIIHPENSITVSVVDAFELDQFDSESIKTLISKSQKKVSSANNDDIVDGKIELRVLEDLQSAINK